MVYLPIYQDFSYMFNLKIVLEWVGEDYLLRSVKGMNLELITCMSFSIASLTLLPCLCSYVRVSVLDYIRYCSSVETIGNDMLR